MKEITPSIFMEEYRAKIASLEETREKILKAGGVLRGDYAFTDKVFFQKDEENSKDVLRVRVYRKGDAKGKQVMVVQKELRTRDKRLEQGFDSLEDAVRFIEGRFGRQYTEGFEYSRVGWEYILGKAVLFLEDIEGLGAEKAGQLIMKARESWFN